MQVLEMCIAEDLQYKQVTKYVDSNRLFNSLAPSEDATMTLRVFFLIFGKVTTHNCKQSLDVCIQGVICWDLLLLKRAASEDDVLTNLPLNEKPYLISIWPISLSVSTLWIALDHVQCAHAVCARLPQTCQIRLNLNFILWKRRSRFRD